MTRRVALAVLLPTLLATACTPPGAAPSATPSSSPTTTPTTPTTPAASRGPRVSIGPVERDTALAAAHRWVRVVDEARRSGGVGQDRETLSAALGGEALTAFVAEMETWRAQGWRITGETREVSLTETPRDGDRAEVAYCLDTSAVIWSPGAPRPEHPFLTGTLSIGRVDGRLRVVAAPEPRAVPRC